MPIKIMQPEETKAFVEDEEKLQATTGLPARPTEH